MPTTTDLLLLALIVLVAAVVAARAYMAYRSLAAAAARTRVSTVVLADRTPTVLASLVDTRARLAGVNASVEHGLWALARWDGSVDGATQSLLERRAVLDATRTGHLVAASDLLHRARAAGRVVIAALRLRRSFFG